MLPLVLGALLAAPASTFREPPVTRVGSVVMTVCPDAPVYYCGSLRRPLDPAGEVPGSIRIAFRFLPHSDRSVWRAGTIVAAEGGPGDPSGGSRDAYRALFEPLLRSRDLLLMDDRGTGSSGAIDCEPLQHAPEATLADVTRCGRMLGHRADLYGSASAADDLDALLGALDAGPVDLYGDSYGTFFVQVFAARHPSRIRSVTLDGAYPAIGDDPWYPSYAPTIRAAFDTVCRRSPACARVPGTSMERIGRLLQALRKHPGPVTATQLAFVMDSAGLNTLAFRELDAAARAYLAADPGPLARLVRDAYDYEERPAGTVSDHSQGLFAAASCEDNPQAYDMRLPPAARERAWQRALAARRRADPQLFAPFTIDEFLAIPVDFAYVPLCRSWPVASAKHPAGVPFPPGTAMPRVPALVLTGDLDTITTPSEGDAAAALYARAHRVIVANSGHVTAVGDVHACASQLVRRFIENGSLNARCAAAIAPMRLVPAFATDSRAVEPASAAAGNASTRAQLRVAAAAVWAAADALGRANAYGMAQAPGLRGGRFHAGRTDHGIRVDLSGVRWTSDVSVSGTVSQSGNGRATASLLVGGASHGVLRAAWNVRELNAICTISGSLDGRNVAATMPAP